MVWWNLILTRTLVSNQPKHHTADAKGFIHHENLGIHGRPHIIRNPAPMGHTHPVAIALSPFDPCHPSASTQKGLWRPSKILRNRWKIDEHLWKAMQEKLGHSHTKPSVNNSAADYIIIPGPSGSRQTDRLQQPHYRINY